MSNVTVDDEEKEMYYQIHAGTNGLRIVDDNDDKFRGVVLLGGYIYPAGSDIFHDPSYSVSAVLVDLVPELNLAPFVLMGMVAVATLVMVGVAVHLRHRSKRRRMPPAFGRLD